jgi:hypothetical protein
MAKRVTESIRQRAEHLLVLVAQELGQGERQIGGLATLQGRFVRGGDHHDGAGEAGFAEGLLDEFADLPAPLADQPDHHRVARGLARQHGEQHRLSDARAGEDAEPLAPAAGGEDVHGPHPEVQPLADPSAGVGGRRRRAQRIGRRPLGQRALAVDRLAEGVDDAAPPGQGRAHGRRIGVDADLGPRRDALHRTERHQERDILAEAHHLAGKGAGGGADDRSAGADREPRQTAAGLDQ